jgi:hypothetical protein
VSAPAAEQKLHRWKFITSSGSYLFIMADTMKEAIARLPEDIDYISCVRVDNDQFLRGEG